MQGEAESRALQSVPKCVAGAAPSCGTLPSHCPRPPSGCPPQARGLWGEQHPPFTLGPPPWKGQAHTALQIRFVHLCGIQIRKHVCTQTARQTSAEDSMQLLKICDCHAAHYLPLKKNAAVHFQIPKMHLNGSSCHLQFNNEVQIKPDLKSTLDACILDIKFIHMHKEIRMQQVLTSKRSALHHKKALFSFTYNC